MHVTLQADDQLRDLLCALFFQVNWYDHPKILIFESFDEAFTTCTLCFNSCTLTWILDHEVDSHSKSLKLSKYKIHQNYIKRLCFVTRNWQHLRRSSRPNSYNFQYNFNKVQCEICWKNNYTALICHCWLNMNYQSPFLQPSWGRCSSPRIYNVSPQGYVASSASVPPLFVFYCCQCSIVLWLRWNFPRYKRYFQYLWCLALDWFWWCYCRQCSLGISNFGNELLSTTRQTSSLS